MSATNITEVSDQIQKFWSPLLVPELKEAAVLPSLVSADYQGEIKQGGDTVYVSMVQAATGSTSTISADGSHTTIESEKMKTQRVGIVADKIFSASFELDSLIDLQTQLADPSAKQTIREALMKGVELQINKHLYSLVSPSLATPDHSISGVATFDEDAILAHRVLASQAKWPADDRFTLMDPSYYGQFLKVANMTSKDFVGDEAKVGGQIVQKRYGFNVLEDNSDAMGQLSPSSAGSKFALSFHKSFMYLVLQEQATFKISDLHSTKKRGYLITVDVIGGAKLGLQGALKHIVSYNA